MLSGFSHISLWVSSKLLKFNCAIVPQTYINALWNCVEIFPSNPSPLASSLSISLSTSHTKTIERNYFIVIKSHFLLCVTLFPPLSFRFKASLFCNIVCSAAIIMLWTGKFTIVVHIIIKLSAIKFINICEIFINLIVKQTQWGGAMQCNMNNLLFQRFVTVLWIECIERL